MNSNLTQTRQKSASFDLIETGEVCPVTGLKFRSHPDWTLNKPKFGWRKELFSNQIVVDRVWGNFGSEEVRSCLAWFDHILERLPGPVVLVQDFSGLVACDHRARRTYEQGLIERSDRIRGVVFVGVRPMFRLYLRLGLRLRPMPFPMHLATSWQDVIVASASILEGQDQNTLGMIRKLKKFRRKLALPKFLLRGYADELRNLVSDMPWDSSARAQNPLPAKHPFHEVVEAWVAVKRDMDWLDKLRQERERDLHSTAKTLAESEGRYRAVFDASGTALILYGADRRIRMVNRATERMSKMPRHEMEERFEWTHFVHPEDTPLLIARHNARQIDPNTDLGRLECRLVDSTGELHWVYVTVESIPHTDLRVASLEDRTEFRFAHLALEESERRFRQIVEVSQDGIWTSDLTGRTTWANDCMSELLGCDSTALKQVSFLELMPTEPDQRLEILHSLLDGRSVVFEGRLPRLDDKPAWAIVSVSPIRNANGTITGFFAMCTDITRRHEAENALRDLNRDLEDRVRERTSELENANAELARALRAREDFLASMSHELRTPLAAVLGAIETLREVRSPERKGYLIDLAERNGNQLLTLIEDVLDFARGRAGRLSVAPQPIDPIEAVHGAQQTMELQAIRSHVVMKIKIPTPLPFVQADPVRLRQILTNYINNALRHAVDGGEIELSALLQPHGIRFEVRDRGKGVPVFEQPKLFQPFEQLAPSGRRGGAGLGLALCRQLAHAMGGEVGYEARSGGGSIFWLGLPHATPLDTHSTLLEPPFLLTPELPQDVPPGRVLVVEDEKDLREILSEHLEYRGWDVLVAENGPSALSLFEATGADVAVVDLGLPGMGGLELIGKLRSLRGGEFLGVVALTGQVFPEDAERCRLAGADRFMTKPTSLHKTESVLRELLVQVRESCPLKETVR